MPATAIFGLLGCGLACVAAASVLLRLQAWPIRFRHAFVALAALAVLVPIGDLPIAAYVRGVTGDLSVTTLFLAGGSCAARLAGRTWIARRELKTLCWLIAAAAVFLYPFALGLSPFDPYALGYGSIVFVSVLLAITLVAWRAGLYPVIFIVLAAALACLGGVYESRNLWDYLIDPLAAVYAVVRLSAWALRRRAGEAA